MAENTVEQALAQYREAMEELAPKLSPCPVARQPAAETLKLMYGSSAALPTKPFATCSICGCAGGSSAALKLVVDSKVRTYSAEEVLYLCTPCATVRDVRKCVDFAMQSMAGMIPASATNELVQHFLRVNGRSLEETTVFQEVVNLAACASALLKEAAPRPVAAVPLEQLTPGAAKKTTRKASVAEKAAKAPQAETAAAAPKKKKKKVKAAA